MRHTEPVPAPAPAAPLSLGGRVAALRSEVGLAGVAAIAWSRFWMALAGLPVTGRVSTRLAAAGCRPYYGRHRLARYHSRGYVAPG